MIPKELTELCAALRVEKIRFKKNVLCGQKKAENGKKPVKMCESE
jgi:hypothetical protein